MSIEDLQDVAQLRVIVTMQDGHDSTLYGTGETPHHSNSPKKHWALGP